MPGERPWWRDDGRIDDRSEAGQDPSLRAWSKSRGQDAVVDLSRYREAVERRGGEIESGVIYETVRSRIRIAFHSGNDSVRVLIDQFFDGI